MRYWCNIHYPDGSIKYSHYGKKPFVGYKYYDKIIVEMIEDENGKPLEVWLDYVR